MAFPGASLAQANQHYLLRLQLPMQFLSSAPLGDGLVSSAWVFSQQVDVDDDLSEPIDLLRQRARAVGVPEGEEFVGLLTSVYHGDLQVYTVKEHGLTVTTLATVGVTHGSSPRVRRVSDYGMGDDNLSEVVSRTGTINIAALIDADLSSGAMIRASTAATEAKTLALFEDGQTTENSCISTGTPTDVTVVRPTRRGKYFQYAGSATLVGWLVGHVTYQAVRNGLIVSKAR